MPRPDYIRQDRSWTWETGTANERAHMIRNHADGARPLSREALKELFRLSDEGLTAILNGDLWRPEYQQTPGA